MDMISLANRLDVILDKHLPALQLIPEFNYNLRPAPNKWSKKEIMGHMIDSAQNNIRRIIVAQYDERLAGRIIEY